MSHLFAIIVPKFEGIWRADTNIRNQSEVLRHSKTNWIPERNHNGTIMTQFPAHTHSSQRRGAGSSPLSRPRQQPQCSRLSCETSRPGRPEAGWSPRTGPLQSPLVSSYCRYQRVLRRRHITHNLAEQRWGWQKECLVSVAKTNGLPGSRSCSSWTTAGNVVLYLKFYFVNTITRRYLLSTLQEVVCDVKAAVIKIFKPKSLRWI